MDLDKIKVVLVDNEPTFLEGLAELLKRTVENDICVVGQFGENTPKVRADIIALDADVGLIDLVLGDGILPEDAFRIPEYSGLDLISSLRNEGAKDIKLVAFSGWPQFLTDAYEAGADEYFNRTARPDSFRQMIRYVAGRSPVRPDNPFYIGRVTSLELFPATREIILHGDRSTAPMRFEASPFALLHYLALERQKDEEHWVTKIDIEDSTTYDIPKCRMNQVDLWENIAVQHKIAKQKEIIDLSLIALWASKINNHVALKKWKSTTSKIELVRGPRFRRPRGEIVYYTLHASFMSTGIVIRNT